MASAIEIYNRALSRIGIDQFISDPAETSKAGSLYRLWYDNCVTFCLREFPWNFASRVVALAQLDGNPLPGWQFKYAYPVDCLAARTIADANGIRSTLTGFSQMNCWPYPSMARLPVPYTVMSESLPPNTVRRVICTDLAAAYLFYTAAITDPNQFDAAFTNALEWLLAAEIAAPFLGAPAGPQVSNQAGQQYRNALVAAAAQTLNESGADTRPDSPAITARA